MNLSIYLSGRRSVCYFWKLTNTFPSSGEDNFVPSCALPLICGEDLLALSTAPTIPQFRRRATEQDFALKHSACRCINFAIASGYREAQLPDARMFQPVLNKKKYFFGQQMFYPVIWTR
jgi:hypothetical protein